MNVLMMGLYKKIIDIPVICCSFFSRVTPQTPLQERGGDKKEEEERRRGREKGEAKGRKRSTEIRPHSKTLDPPLQSGP